jgi:8-oxo-dGTP diphosphatase
MVRSSVAVVHELVSTITPVDGLELEHITDTLRWLESTDDVFRRAKPATPSRHLVSYVVLLDSAKSILLVDHVNAGLFLPPGGHVHVDEHPAVAARRECQEELGLEVSIAATPSFLTVTTTVGMDAGHTDVSLWFVSKGSKDMQLVADQVEFRGVRWWTVEELVAAPAAGFDPHFGRFVQKVLSVEW